MSFEKIHPEGKVWLARHAKAPHNIYDDRATFAGSRVNPEITEQGREQSRELAEEIYQEGGCDLIYCSQMIRSKQTAEEIAKKLKELCGREIDIFELDDLEEVDVGDFTNHTEQEAREMDPAAATAFYEGQVERWSFPDGEKYEDMQKRAESVKKQIKEKTPEEARALVVGHGMFNRVLMHEYFPKREDLWQPRSVPHDRVISFNLPEEITEMVVESEE